MLPIRLSQSYLSMPLSAAHQAQPITSQQIHWWAAPPEIGDNLRNLWHHYSHYRRAMIYCLTFVTAIFQPVVYLRRLKEVEAKNTELVVSLSSKEEALSKLNYKVLASTCHQSPTFS